MLKLHQMLRTEPLNNDEGGAIVSHTHDSSSNSSSSSSSANINMHVSY